MTTFQLSRNLLLPHFLGERAGANLRASLGFLLDAYQLAYQLAFMELWASAMTLGEQPLFRR